MQAGRLLTSTLSGFALLAAGGLMVQAQEARPWVDPPPQDGSSPRPALPPKPEAEQGTEPPRPPAAEPRAKTAGPPSHPEMERRTARAAAAKSFAIDYLTSWSARNDVALDATAELYAPRVLFHGRTVNLKRVYKEKQRFTRRWPERDYRPRQDAIGAACNPPGTVCTVHAVFDYTAANPRRRRMSQGSGALQLVVEFIGDRPVIVAEHSTLLAQARKPILTSEDTSNE